MPVLEIIERWAVPMEASEPLATRSPADPFGIDDPCPMNAGGPHCDVVECHEISCAACGRIIWA